MEKEPSAECEQPVSPPVVPEVPGKMRILRRPNSDAQLSGTVSQPVAIATNGKGLSFNFF